MGPGAAMSWEPRLYGDRSIKCDIERGNLNSHGSYDVMVFESTYTWDSDWQGIYSVQAWMPDTKRGGWRRLALSVEAERGWARYIEMRLQDR